MRHFIILIFVFSCMLGLAQKATITGTVTDKDMNNEPLPFANVIVKGTKSGTTTDDFGNFTLTVEPGNLNVEFSFLGYETVVVPVVIKAGQTLKLNQVLGSGEGVSLQDVVIATSRRKNTESALVLEMKEAKQVISAISAEQMSKGTDSNAAEAVMRVPGISLVDGRFIIVRGLPERYNNVTINGGIAPSTEVDRRTFAFDLIPTDVLDKIVVYKTASADKLGDFAGGLINLTTSDNTTEFTKASISIGYRDGTTFNNQIHTEKSNTDWLGFDNGLRSLPSGFPSTAQFDEFTPLSEARMNAGRSLANNWNPSVYSTFFDSSAGFSFGRKFNVGNTKVYSVNVLKYSQQFQSYNKFFSEAQEVENNPITGELPAFNTKFLDDTYKEEVTLNALSNWVFRFNDNHTLKFKNFFSQIGENETILRTGETRQRGEGVDFKNYSFGYRSKSIYSTQFEGLHKLNSTNELDWVLGYNYIRENMPDLRRIRFFDDTVNSTNGFINFAPPSSSLTDNSRFFSNLEEFNVTQGLNFTHIIERNNEEEDFAPFKLKTGYLVDYKYRLFKSRYFSYLLPGGVNLARQDELLALPINQIFAPENISQTNGWILEEGTRPDNSYKADNFLTSGYVMADMPVGKFDINLGLRAENNMLRFRYFDQTGLYDKVDKNIFNLLPSVNIGYALNETSQLRTAYSKTVNRPEFREIAPFLFYEFEFNVSKQGNTNLDSATIDNFDVRYEWYPRKGEVLSLGGFYKSFTNPIEIKNLISTEQRSFSIFNAPKAQNYGVELEAKKSFKDVFNNPFLDRFSLNLNASYVFSEVDLGTGDLAEDRKRPLQGQSPYVVNFGLEYADENDFSVYLTYNEFGDRIFSVGNIAFATIMEKARGQLDLSVSKKIKNIGVKLSAENIYNNRIRFYEDTQKDYKINTKNDYLWASFRRGSLFSLNLTYNF